MSRLRLDDALVQRGLYPSRARARDAILRGTVSVDGVVAAKPAQNITADAEIIINDDARSYVSRAALKLKAALDRFALDPKGRGCLDLGASTGGFTQVLLEQGARHVTAVDVGHGQMAEALRADPRVTVIEGLNARDIARDHAPDVEFITADVSFISLKLALPAALALARKGAPLVALIKPQFEAGREAVGKTGVIADPVVHDAVCRDIAQWLDEHGWRIIGLMPAPIEGGDGNREFLIGAVKN